jgi:hypothetical protein
MFSIKIKPVLEKWFNHSDSEYYICTVEEEPVEETPAEEKKE